MCINPSNQMFGLLSFAEDPEERTANVVTLSWDGLMFRLAKKHALAAQEGAARETWARWSTRTRASRRVTPGLWLALPRRRTWRTATDMGGDTCRCDCCAGKWEFRKNIPPNGPQALYDCEMSTFGWLRFLGIDTA
jgi:hypothetical protein